MRFARPEVGVTAKFSGALRAPGLLCTPLSKFLDPPLPPTDQGKRPDTLSLAEGGVWERYGIRATLHRWPGSLGRGLGTYEANEIEDGVWERDVRLSMKLQRGCLTLDIILRS